MLLCLFLFVLSGDVVNRGSDVIDLESGFEQRAARTIRRSKIQLRLEERGGYITRVIHYLKIPLLSLISRNVFAPSLDYISLLPKNATQPKPQNVQVRPHKKMV